MPDAGPSVEIPAVVLDALGASANDVLLVLDGDLTITWVSPSSLAVVGWRADELVGRGAFELLHLDELERALIVATAAAGGYSPRSTARYRVRAPDGSWVECDLSVGRIGPDGGTGGLAVWVRRAYDQLILREVVAGLLSDDATDQVLGHLLDLVFARNDVSRCAITFEDEVGRLTTVGNDLPPALAGVGDGPDGPWSRARHGLVETLAPSAEDLPPELAEAARAAGLGGLWVVPITEQQGELDHDGGDGDGPVGDERTWAATATVWTVAGGPTPQLNTYAVGLLRQLVALVVRWRRQVTDLAAAARQDPLTGLANRRVLDELAEREPDDGWGPMAVLALDLDRFKPVNDRFGHAAGDEALLVTAQRIRRAVRDDDVVLRLGGDEFAIACADLDESAAVDLAERLRAAVASPIAILGDRVHIGTSIGIAVGADSPTTLLARADAALYEAKGDGAGIAVAPRPTGTAPVDA